MKRDEFHRASGIPSEGRAPASASGAQHYVKVALNTPLRGVFDYLPPAGCPAEHLQVGMRVQLPFGKKGKTVGMVLGHSHESDVGAEKLRRIDRPLDATPTLDKAHLALLTWASRYYHHPVGQVIFQTLPPALRRPRPQPAPATAAPGNHTHGDDIALNQAQKDAIEELQRGDREWRPFLLYGVTGSGKTEVYLQAIKHALLQQKQALVMLPEIGLTPQILERFRAFFSTNIVLMHSGLSNGERLQSWLQARAGTASIIIGTRSAVWMPLARPGAYILDEEHDTSYKQQSGFLYSARDIALVRAKRDAATAILGSATPSLETLHCARDGKYHLLSLPERAGRARQTDYRLIDLRSETLRGALSLQLVTAMQRELDEGNQVLLFRNRRGYATHLLCHNCGNKIDCPRCERPYTWHKQRSLLICHHCEARKKRPAQCADCNADALVEAGHGTERVEETLSTLFPGQGIARIDQDTTRGKQRGEDMMRLIAQGRAKIIIGTQMLAKGHHFPNITLSGIIDADRGLFSNDYRASERLAQLLMQVSGRSGRGHKPGRVWIQTHFPSHPLLQTLIQGDYQKVAEQLLIERRAATLPPYSFHALLRAEAKRADIVRDFMEQARDYFPQQGQQTTSIFGPVAAPIEKRAGWYRMQLLLQSSQRRHLHGAIAPWLAALESSKFSRRVRWSIDIDPQDMM